MRIAVAQTPGTRLEAWRETLALIAGLIERAADVGAELVVLPECVWPAYVVGSPAAYAAARSAGLPGEEAFLESLAGQARARRLMICAGYIEERSGRLWNSAALIGADGRLLGVHRKCFLWDFDHACFAPGEALRPIETPHGPVGLMICADARLPEIPATLAARGARLLLQPTGWVNAGTPERPWNPQPDFLIRARAREFGVPIASASKWGREGDTEFVGSSLICDADGNVVARCGRSGTDVAVAEVALRSPRPPDVSDQERGLLLSSAGPTYPRADAGTLLLLPVSRVPDDWGSLSADVRGAEVVLAVTPPDSRPPHFRRRSGTSYAVLCGPSERPFELGRASIAGVAAAAVERFAPVRCLALGGVHVVAAFGKQFWDPELRARACENRVYMVAAAADGWRVVDPRGLVLAEGPWPDVIGCSQPVALDLNAAADKCVAPGTDMLAGRAPGQYAL